MDTVTLNWISLLALSLVPAAVVFFILRSHYNVRIDELRHEKHIDVTAEHNQMSVQVEILRDRLAEESKAHLRTIQLLTRGRTPGEGGAQSNKLEERLRQKNEHYEVRK